MKKLFIDGIPLEEFQEGCNKNKCFRYKSKSKTCKKEYKQVKCYDKYIKDLNKKADYLNFRRDTWIQDIGSFPKDVKRQDWRYYCRLWNILTDEERNYLNESFDSAEKYVAINLDVCHIDPKGEDIKGNAVVCSRYFHNLLDNLYHPVYKDERISKEERLEWFKSAKKRAR